MRAALPALEAAVADLDEADGLRHESADEVVCIPQLRNSKREYCEESSQRPRMFLLGAGMVPTKDGNCPP